MESSPRRFSVIIVFSLMVMAIPANGCHVKYPDSSDFLQINLLPTNQLDVTTNELEVSCLPRENQAIREILLLQVSKDSRDAVIFADIRGASAPTPSSGSSPSGSLQGASNIDKEIAKSYLNVSVPSPTQDDSGLYICTMYYVDQNNLVKIDSVSSKINWDSSDMVLKRLALLESRIEHLSTLESQVENLSTLLQAQSKLVTNLQRKENKPVAFHVSATMSSHHGRIVFPTIIMQEGTGYDPKTGLFTAPTDGLYTFNLASSTAHNNWVKAQIKVNGESSAQVYAGDNQVAQHASVSTVVMLKTGDTVEAVVTYWQRSDTISFYFVGYRLSKQ